MNSFIFDIWLHVGREGRCFSYQDGNNLDIDLENQSADSRSYYTVVQSTPEFDLQTIIAGRYHDSFFKSDGKWQFKKRVMIVDLMGDCSSHLLIDQNF